MQHGCHASGIALLLLAAAGFGLCSKVFHFVVAHDRLHEALDRCPVLPHASARANTRAHVHTRAQVLCVLFVPTVH